MKLKELEKSFEKDSFTIIKQTFPKANFIKHSTFWEWKINDFVFRYYFSKNVEFKFQEIKIFKDEKIKTLYDNVYDFIKYINLLINPKGLKRIKYIF